MAKDNDNQPRIFSSLVIIGMMVLIFLWASGCGEVRVALSADPVASATLTGSGKYAKGTEITVQAAPAEGWEFKCWTQNGKIAAETEIYTFIVEERTKLVAHLLPREYAIGAFAQGEGSVVCPDGPIVHGEEVAVQAVPAAGHRFAYWSEDGEVVSTSAEYSFTAGADRNLGATFLPDNYVAEIKIEGEGRVTETWALEPEIAVTLTAIAEDGYEFFGWVDAEVDQEIETETVFSFAWQGPRKLLARFRKELIPVDGNSLIAVVGKESTIGDYAPDDLVELPSYISSKNKKVRREVAEALELLYLAAEAEGVSVHVNSAYRSFKTQYGLFYRYASDHGVLAAERFSARPGQSEHQLGTAVDFSGTNSDFSDGFADTSQGRWLLANAYKFGFALSYPRDNEEITGYIYEPWHYRYIGVELAKEWKESGLTLIEFLRTKN